MEINVELKPNTIKFKKIKVGDTFLFQDKLWMKTDGIIPEDDGTCPCTNLKDGHTRYFDDMSDCLPVECIVIGKMNYDALVDKLRDDLREEAEEGE